MRKVHDEITLLNEELSQLALGIIEKVSASADEVSIALDPIFKRAVVYSPDELQRARGRKERGNPPGKKNDPLGDQLTWEQILSRCAGIRKMWIISRDSDYGTVCRGKFFMNQFLHGELRKASPSIEVFWFEDVSEGIKHFTDVTGVKAEHLPTREQIEEIKKEEESLPPLWVPQQDNSAELAVAARRNWLRRSSAFIGGSNTLGSTLPWS
jgi:hypothetical protein